MRHAFALIFWAFAGLSGVAAWGADPPPPATMSEEVKQQRLADRDRLVEEADALCIEGKVDEARRKLLEALAITREVFGTDHDQIAARLGALFDLEQQAADFAAARNWLRQSQEMYARLHGASYYRVLRAKLWLRQNEQLEKFPPEKRARYDAAFRGWMKSKQSWKQGKYAEAETEVAKAAATFQELFGEEDLAYLFAVVDLSMDKIQLGKYDEGQKLLDTAQDLAGRLLDETDPTRAGLLLNLGANYYYGGNSLKALKPLCDALKLQKKNLGESHSQTGVVHTHLGHVLSSLGRNADAEVEFRAALKIADETYGPDHSEVGVCESNLAGLLVFMNRYVKADLRLQSATKTIAAKVVAVRSNRFMAAPARLEKFTSEMDTSAVHYSRPPCESSVLWFRSGGLRYRYLGRWTSPTSGCYSAVRRRSASRCIAAGGRRS